MRIATASVRTGFAMTEEERQLQQPSHSHVIARRSEATTRHVSPQANIRSATERSEALSAECIRVPRLLCRGELCSPAG